MNIKITTENTAEIERALSAVAGKVTVGMYNAIDIRLMAETAEGKLEVWGLPKAMRSGATYTVGADGADASSYKYARVCMDVTIRRGSGAWYLVSVTRTERRPHQYGPRYYTLTEGQHRKMIEVVCRRRRISPLVQVKS